jgi:hypothetical protein
MHGRACRRARRDVRIGTAARRRRTVRRPPPLVASVERRALRWSAVAGRPGHCAATSFSPDMATPMPRPRPHAMRLVTCHDIRPAAVHPLVRAPEWSTDRSGLVKPSARPGPGRLRRLSGARRHRQGTTHRRVEKGRNGAMRCRLGGCGRRSCASGPTADAAGPLLSAARTTRGPSRADASEAIPHAGSRAAGRCDLRRSP